MPGNQYKKIQKQDLEKTLEVSEKVWLSNFQSDNKNCSADLKKLILSTFKNVKQENKETF